MHNPRSSHPRPSDQTLVSRNVEDNPHCKVSDRARTVDVSLKTGLSYLHKPVYYGRAARWKPLHPPINIKRRKDMVHEMVVRSLVFWVTVIFFDESQFFSQTVIECGSGDSVIKSFTPKDCSQPLSMVVMVWGAI